MCVVLTVRLVWTLLCLWAPCGATRAKLKPLIGHRSPMSELLASYKERHKEATTNPKSESRFIISGEAEGVLGNSYPGIISALFLALMTERVLLVKAGTAMQYLDHGELDFRYEEQVHSWQMKLLVSLK